MYIICTVLGIVYLKLKPQPYTIIWTSMINLDGEHIWQWDSHIIEKTFYKDASDFPHNTLLSITSILEHDVLIMFSFPGFPEATATCPHGMGLNSIKFTVLLNALVLCCCWTDQLCSNKSYLCQVSLDEPFTLIRLGSVWAWMFIPTPFKSSAN